MDLNLTAPVSRERVACVSWRAGASTHGAARSNVHREKSTLPARLRSEAVAVVLCSSIALTTSTTSTTSTLTRAPVFSCPFSGLLLPPAAASPWLLLSALLLAAAAAAGTDTPGSRTLTVPPSVAAHQSPPGPVTQHNSIISITGSSSSKHSRGPQQVSLGQLTP